jgi:hypothetical protein
MKEQKILCPLGRAMTNKVKHSKARRTKKGGYDKGIVGKKSKAPLTILRKKVA